MERKKEELQYNEFHLDHLSFSIFKELYLSPLTSLRQIAVKLGVSLDSIRRRYWRMKNTGLLRNNLEYEDIILGKRLISEVIGEHNPGRLGLQRVFVLIKKIHCIEDLKHLEALFTLYPYFHRSLQVIGEDIGLFLELDMPPNSEHFLLSLLIEIRNMGLYRDIEVFIPEEEIVTKHYFDLFEKTMFREKIPIGFPFNKNNEIKGLIDNAWKRTSKIKRIQGQDVSRKNITPLTKPLVNNRQDIMIIRELCLNPKISISKLAIYYRKEPSTMSVKVRKTVQKFLTLFSLVFDKAYFEITTFLIIIGEFNKNLDKNRLAFIMSDYFPFQNKLYTQKDSFLIITELPPLYAQVFTKKIWENAKNVEIYFGLPLTEKTQFINPLNFNEEEEKWIENREYLVDKPAEFLDSKIT